MSGVCCRSWELTSGSTWSSELYRQSVPRWCLCSPEQQSDTLGHSALHPNQCPSQSYTKSSTATKLRDLQPPAQVSQKELADLRLGERGDLAWVPC